MKKYILPGLLSAFWLSCGDAGTVQKEIVVEKDTVLVTETAPKDSFLVFGHLEFPSEDGLLMTANSYEIIPSDQYIVLCHQANSSRGEYKEIARILNQAGYNCMAIDQRSGGESNHMVNETALQARQKNLPVAYTDAEQDILAAIDYLYSKTNRKVILLGSSYSASLALKVGKSNEKVEAVVAFSPSECLNGFKLREHITGFDKPVFVSSSRKEAKEVVDLVSGIKPEAREIFVPVSEGAHGASALWSSTSGHQEYWTALKDFLARLRKPA